MRKKAKDMPFYVRHGFCPDEKTVMRAQLVSDNYPEFINGADIWRNDDGSWSIETDWGTSTGFPGRAYWLQYGTKPDGNADADIISKEQKSYRDFVVCDENGRALGWLYEFDPD